MATTTRRGATEEDLLAMPEDGWKYELVDGEIRMSPAGFRHGQVCIRLASRLQTFVEARKLGAVVDSSTGFRLPGGNVRVPDAAFVSRERMAGAPWPEGLSPVPPDLAVEVLSPTDRPRFVLDRVGEYLEAGVRLVWVIDPAGGGATVYRSLGIVRDLAADGVLEGEDVLPGFCCSLRELLTGL
jgi:Uma2 family endonuclease